MHSRWSLLFLTVGGIVASCAPASAAVKPHALFSEGVVLQRGMTVPVWGTADAEEKVTVRFQNQNLTTTADRTGKWQVRLEKLEAGGPFEMTIAGSGSSVAIKNVLIGEVWICSGQSNMAWTVRASSDPDKTIAESANPKIRLFTVPRTASREPLSDVVGSWKECGPETVASFSAVAYHFGRDLQQHLKVPIGLIHTSWGGTPAESWTSRATLESYPELKGLVENYDRALSNYQQNETKLKEQYKLDLAKHQEAVKKAKAEGKQPPTAPREPISPAISPSYAANLHNGMIAPLVPYAMRGAIWYQGESNAPRALQYRTLFPAMIKNWRADWKQGDFPFLFVQLAPFKAIVKEPQESDWAELREAQLLTSLKVPNTAMAVITDAGDEKDIHPKQKETVGKRLALAARGTVYGESVVPSGPLYVPGSLKIEGDQAILGFKHVGSGLEFRGDSGLQGFTIAGADRVFHNARAEIKGDQIVVRSPQVARPVAVRFGWANYPVVNLWNKNGLPASPFRTDDFPMVTDPKTPK
jgi:sialate O-acetylesterase